MPGTNPRALEKARGLPADGLIIDLEDAVAADAKEAARAIAAAALAAGGYGKRELVLRVNPLDTPWGHGDLAAAATMPIDAVLLPKVENPDRVRLALSLLDALGAPERLAVWCMIETPLGVLAAREIAAASPRLAALVLGTSDLTKELHAVATRDRLPLRTSLGLAMLAARAYRLAILDGVYLDLSDEEGFALLCRQGRELGFDGKTLIHPKQIALANAAYAPSAKRSNGRAASSPPMPKRRAPAKASCWSTANWSKACTSRMRADCWWSPARSTGSPPLTPPDARSKSPGRAQRLMRPLHLPGMSMPGLP
jgi:citrate lyase subunit beta/citryl-CoA lyase